MTDNPTAKIMFPPPKLILAKALLRKYSRARLLIRVSHAIVQSSPILLGALDNGECPDTFSNFPGPAVIMMLLDPHGFSGDARKLPPTESIPYKKPLPVRSAEEAKAVPGPRELQNRAVG